MGAGWYVALEQEIPGVGGVLPHNGKALLFAQHHLEEIARRLGFPPLKAFFSSDPTAVAGYLHEQGIAADPDELAAEEWYDAAEALPTVRRLIESLNDPPVGMGHVDRVLADLSAMETVLDRSATAGVRFHIATGLTDLNEMTERGG
ncbi:MAG TPA: hypothetical protein VH120_12315 [Gemmataceae bacterium]|nr:hypothetical protein [Gemmataceae bacterium]